MYNNIEVGKDTETCSKQTKLKRTTQPPTKLCYVCLSPPRERGRQAKWVCLTLEAELRGSNEYNNFCGPSPKKKKTCVCPDSPPSRMLQRTVPRLAYIRIDRCEITAFAFLKKLSSFFFFLAFRQSQAPLPPPGAARARLSFQSILHSSQQQVLRTRTPKIACSPACLPACLTPLPPPPFFLSNYRKVPTCNKRILLYRNAIGHSLFMSLTVVVIIVHTLTSSICYCLV